MNFVVIDTNVLIVANGGDGKSATMSSKCEKNCIDRLERVKASETPVVDAGWLIFNEYNQKCSTKGAPTPGNTFLKWMLQKTERFEAVNITALNHPEDTIFEEFPNDPDLENAFDPADRKFVAVANAHPDKPPILEAADSKWLGWEEPLAKKGIRVDFVCREELAIIREKKSKKKQ